MISLNCCVASILAVTSMTEPVHSQCFKPGEEYRFIVMEADRFAMLLFPFVSNSLMVAFVAVYDCVFVFCKTKRR